MALSSLVLAAGLARAQTPATLGSTVTYTLSASVVGGNGIEPVNPGESVLLTISVSFSGQNTTASYSPAIPAPGSGTIRGFGMGFIDHRFVRLPIARPINAGQSLPRAATGSAPCEGSSRVLFTIEPTGSLSEPIDS